MAVKNDIELRVYDLKTDEAGVKIAGYDENEVEKALEEAIRYVEAADPWAVEVNREKAHGVKASINSYTRKGGWDLPIADLLVSATPSHHDLIEAALHQNRRAACIGAINNQGQILLDAFSESSGRLTALLYQPNAVSRYIVAHGYDPSTGSWSHGSYFSDPASAYNEAHPDIIADAFPPQTYSGWMEELELEGLEAPTPADAQEAHDRYEMTLPSALEDEMTRSEAARAVIEQRDIYRSETINDNLALTVFYTHRTGEKDWTWSVASDAAIYPSQQTSEIVQGTASAYPVAKAYATRAVEEIQEDAKKLEAGYPEEELIHAPERAEKAIDEGRFADKLREAFGKTLNASGSPEHDAPAPTGVASPCVNLGYRTAPQPTTSKTF